uniref:Uncharacterized protein n=1 Tax=Rhipicephalus pulchellus TaxID=72859 RepID=L7LYA5_RHIPC
MKACRLFRIMRSFRAAIFLCLSILRRRKRRSADARKTTKTTAWQCVFRRCAAQSQPPLSARVTCAQRRNNVTFMHMHIKKKCCKAIINTFRAIMQQLI